MAYGMRKGKKTGGGPMRHEKAKGRAPSKKGPKTGGAPMSHEDRYKAMMGSIKGDPDV